MEDTISRSSLDSTSTGGDDYVVVNAEPRLKIANNGDVTELVKTMSEVLSDDKSPSEESTTSSCNSMLQSTDSLRALRAEETNVAENKGHINRPSRVTLSTSLMRPGILAWKKYIYGSGQSSPMTPDGQVTLFTGITYLGSATVNAPRSEVEINRNMAVLNEQSQMAIPVILSVPPTSEGTVRIIDPGTDTDITSYRIHRILFCARGPADTSERRCFAFTCSHGDSADTAIFQCHVFRCDQGESVGKILYSFATAFRRVPKSVSNRSLSSINEHNIFRFDVSVEFKEDDGKGNFSTCPKDKNVFKLRSNIEKKILINVNQVTNKELKIERCFGLLISPGRNVKQNDLHLIDMVSMGMGNDGRSYIISGLWDPTDPNFQILNTETPKDTRVFMTIAVDLVIEGIQEPVRFLVETKAKIFPTSERFWYFSKKPHHETFILKLKELEEEEGDKQQTGYEVISIESQSDLDRKKNLTLTITSNKVPPENIHTPQEGPDEESDGDEPLLSGSGVVSKEVTDEELLMSWHEVLTKWHQNLKQRPKQVSHLVRKGIPEALRGEVWQLLAGCHENTDMLEAYRVLITKDSPCEQVILRDINRTFPAHDYFKEAGGVGQDSLFKISKAYSVYDAEIGYCQGLSFLAASLLLHMPEEQAFCVLVRIMFDYSLRDLFKAGFQDLQMNFYKLERLMQDQIPDLFDHFMELGLEAHMFASQWFLTLFTAKFPLFMVYRILDLYLCEGMDTIFAVALALLKTSRKDLLALDFEGILKYFRVHLPKKYRSEESAHELLQLAVTLRVSNKKLKKYEKEYLTMEEQQRQEEDPVERFERENKMLMEANMRLEQENDDLAHELVSSKISLRNDLDNSEDKADFLNKELLQTKSMLLDVEEEKRRLEDEAAQLKELCRREHERSESEATRNSAIIADYKQICSQLSERLEKQQTAAKQELERIKAQILKCETCCKLVSPDGSFDNVPEVEPGQIDPAIASRDQQIRELELELAQTKLALVESECRTQDLTHDLNAAVTEIQAGKNNWFHKTLSSFRDAAAK